MNKFNVVASPAYDASYRPTCVWKIIKAINEMMKKSQGQRDYEADVEHRPLYHDGTARKTWDRLGEVERWSWERDTTTRGS